MSDFIVYVDMQEYMVLYHLLTIYNPYSACRQDYQGRAMIWTSFISI